MFSVSFEPVRLESYLRQVPRREVEQSDRGFDYVKFVELPKEYSSQVFDSVRVVANPDGHHAHPLSESRFTDSTRAP